MTDTINGRTPDEIKKALQCRVKGCLEKCDHRCDMCELYVPNYHLEDRYADAYAYILHLESRLAQVEREKDALLMDLQTAACRGHSSNLGCEFCKDKAKPICVDCNWQWRGVCPENTKEPSE